MANILNTGSGKRPWRVQWRERGKSKTRFFAGLADAVLFKKSVEADQEESDLQPSELLAALRIKAVCESHGVDLAYVLERVDRIMPKKSSKNLELAIDACVADSKRRNLRPASVENQEYYLKAFANSHTRRNVSDFTEAEVLEILLSRNQSEQKLMRNYVVGFFNWCAEPPREWCHLDSKKIKLRRKLVDEKTVVIWTAEQAVKLLEAIKPKYSPSVLFCLYAGVRPMGELQRLQWEAVDFKHYRITISGEVSKIRRRRVLRDLPPVLWSELLARGCDKLSGPVCPVSYFGFRRVVRIAANELQLPMGHDVMRHSFGSHFYHWAGFERTIEAMGHLNVATFFSHYKEAVTEDEARDYCEGMSRK